MKIGIAFNLRSSGPASEPGPDDQQEEYDSPTTIDAIASVLRGQGHQVVLLGDGRSLLEKLLADPVDLVFNLAEGQGVGRDREARVPAVLEMLGIPYTGSDPLTLAVTLDKDCARRLVRPSASKAVPRGTVLLPDQRLNGALSDLPFPVIAKPAWEGSSKGIRNKCLIDRPQDLADVVAELRRDYRQPILLEQFIAGDELTVGVIGNSPPQVLGVMRVVPLQPTERFVYSLEVKRDWQRQVRYECPPAYAPELLARIETAALEVFQELGCRDVARIDFRLGTDGLYFLEVNPLPGLSPDYSDLVILARGRGWSYERLLGTIVRAALDRQRIPTHGSHAPTQSSGPV